MLVVSVVLAGCGASESTGGSSEEDSKTLKVVTNAAYAPMEYLEGDKVVGFDIDLVKALAKEAGYEAEVAHTGWDSMFVEVKDEIADLGIAAITITDDRKQSYDFTIPYYASSNMILVPEGSDVKSADDLKGKKIAVQNGTTGQEAAESILGKNSSDVKKFEDNNLAIQELLSGGADAVIADKPVLEGYVKNNPNQKLVVLEDADAFSSDYFGLMFPKDSELDDEFNKAINALFDNGEFTKIYKEWFGVEPDIEDLKAQQ